MGLRSIIHTSEIVYENLNHVVIQNGVGVFEVYKPNDDGYYDSVYRGSLTDCIQWIESK